MHEVLCAHQPADYLAIPTILSGLKLQSVDCQVMEEKAEYLLVILVKLEQWDQVGEVVAVEEAVALAL